ATFELTAERAGVLTRIAKEGDTLSIGDVVCSIETGKETAAKPSESKADKPQSAAADRKQDYAAGTPSPAAAKILAEKGVNAGEVSGTGVGGRITKDDAVKAKSQPVVNSSQPAAASQQPVSGQRNERREKMSSLRKTIAKRLVAVKSETAMLTTFNEVDMKPIMDLRAKYKDKFKEKYGVGLGFMSFFTKA